MLSKKNPRQHWEKPIHTINTRNSFKIQMSIQWYKIYTSDVKSRVGGLDKGVKNTLSDQWRVWDVGLAKVEDRDVIKTGGG